MNKSTAVVSLDVTRSTGQERSPLQEPVRANLLLGAARGAELEPPAWLGQSIEALRREVLDRNYPCYFATIAERQGDLYYSWVESWDPSHLVETLPQFAAIARTAGEEGRRTSLAVFFEPKPGLDHDTMRERFWRLMQFLVDRDPDPAAAHCDPSDPLWMFTFDGEGYFVFTASPTYANRRSRNLGPSFTVVFQPRNVFVGIEGDTAAGVKVRKTIRGRLDRWDALPPHCELKDFGDPTGNEWKQAVLPDDESPVTGRCPLHFDRRPEPAALPAPRSAAEAATLVDLLRGRATETPRGRAYLFLEDGEREGARLTWADLDRRARAIAAELSRRAEPGDRALLLFPPGLDFVTAFFGCLYAGVVAIPSYPVHQKRQLGKLRGLLENGEPRIALTVEALRGRYVSLFEHLSALADLTWISADRVDDAEAASWRRPAGLGEDSIAFLQYTSGSTGDPKGVMVSHRNLLHNEGMIREAFAQSERSVVVGWLPVYHDMGLIGNVIQPLYVGATCVLMAPMAFLQRPRRWLEAISRYRATTSGGPDFAYRYCVEKIPPEAREGLDLSSWRLAFNGSEPVRAETMARFAEAFAGCGFDERAFYPCYGLAEGTLFVTGPETGRTRPRALQLAVEPLERQGRAVPVADDAEGARPAVSCGRVWREQRLVIADPETLEELPAGTVGEILVAGPSVAGGYWRRPEESCETFEARLASGEGPFLRTGDLGFLHRGELFVTGRHKDLIILRGRNHYPQDLELTAGRSHPALRPGCGAAFTVEGSGGERLVIAHEVHRRFEAEAEDAARAIRQAIAEEHEVNVHHVALLRHGALPKTSSGKVQRRACRAAWLDGKLAVVGDGVPAQPAASRRRSLSRVELLALAPEERPSRVEDYLRSAVADLVKAPLDDLAPDLPLSACGLDSLLAVELRNAVDRDLGVVLPVAELLDAPTLKELTSRVLELLAEPQVRRPSIEPSGRAPLGEFPPSEGQKALWFLHQIAPESPAYHIAAAATVRGLDPSALEAAFTRLVERHGALRTTFRATQGQPVQVVHARLDPEIERGDAREWSEGRLRRRLTEIAFRPFDLEGGSLVRLGLFERGSGRFALVLSIHHLVADLWSLRVMIEELEALYREATEGADAGLGALDVFYSDFVRWQQRVLAADAGRRLWEYWRGRLAGDLPDSNLPTDRPRPAVQQYEGESVSVSFDAEIGEGLAGLARSHHVTLYSTLLAAFFVLVGRYGRQRDLLVGSPTSGRGAVELADQVGYYVNPVPLRADLSGGPTFVDFLAATHRTVLAALEHEDFPFALLAERLHPVRNPSRSPLFQVLFSLHQGRGTALAEGLAELALGEEGHHLELAGLRFESLRLDRVMAQFDLTLAVAERGGALTASLQYATALFDRTTMERMLGHYQALLGALLEDPGRSIDRLPLLTAAESRQLLVEANDTAAPLAERGTVHGEILRRAAAHPTAPALVAGRVELSYGELATAVRRMARFLAAAGVGPETRVGIHMERSDRLVVALLGTLAAGGAYVPLDPAYPPDRIAYILADAGVRLVLSDDALAGRLPATDAEVIRVDQRWPEIAASSEEPVPAAAALTGSELAYVIYTSGSTGRPKGVQVPHRTVLNFFRGMDGAVGCGPGDTLLAVTSISFDISVLELFWPLARGGRTVVVGDEALAGLTAGSRLARRPARPLDLSLFYFADEHGDGQRDKYRLLLEGARYADRNGLKAVWTPERHFHAFGGLYANPSITNAALATLTDRVELRAGSVVLPLHNPIRVAEEWSMVDNLSGGRTGIAFASGWHADDFVFFPEKYADRKEIMERDIEVVRRLWRGEAVRARGGAGNDVEVRILPRPIQPELPVWITAAGSPETFRAAGRMGAGVLTHLLGQTYDEVAHKVRVYRAAREEAGLDPDTGTVTLMLHTFVDDDSSRVRDLVREPFTSYLRSSLGLMRNLVKSLGLDLDLDNMSLQDREDLLAFAFDRYYDTSALFGDPGAALETLARVAEIGVDEVACLVDFGLAEDDVLGGLRHLGALLRPASGNGNGRAARPASLADLARDYGATLLQSTPSMMTAVLRHGDTVTALGGLRALLLGGEALPPALAGEVRERLPGVALHNMYGPTETTVWSSTHAVEAREGATVSIGRPIANTSLYVLTPSLEPQPAGTAGELWIGGEGVVRGYSERPGLTAERFVPDPFARVPGSRLYRTGDLTRFGRGGLEVLGRTDQQVKVRGFRVEPGEIESRLAKHRGVAEAVVTVKGTGDAARLVAYYVPRDDPAPTVEALRRHLAAGLPEYMLPQLFVALEELPHTPNNKIDRRALPEPEGQRPELEAELVAPSSRMEKAIAEVWCEVLGLEKVGVRDNFFDLGGHSLLMAQAHGRLQERLGIELPLVKLLEHPTIQSLARFLQQGQVGAFSRSVSEDRARRQRAGRGRRPVPALHRGRPSPSGRPSRSSGT